MKFDLRVWLGTALALTWGFASGAAASPAHFGGQDLVTEYDSATGTLSFGSQLGLVNTDDRGVGVDGLSVFFEVQLDNSPSLTNQAQFGGLPGSLTEIRFIDEGDPENPLDDIVMLAFDVVSLKWTQHSLITGAAGDRITLGDQTPSNFGITSELRVAASPLASLVDGPGTPAIFQIKMGGFTSNLSNGGSGMAWGLDWTTIAASTWDLNTLSAPEPGTALLLGAGLAGLAGVARRARTRR